MDNLFISNKKTILILTCTFILLFFSLQIISAASMECLVKTSDNVLSNSPRDAWTDEMFAEERAGNSKQGYIVTCKSPRLWNNYTEVYNETSGENDTVNNPYLDIKWGSSETDPTKFAIIEIDEKDYDPSWLEPEYDYENPDYRWVNYCREDCDDFVCDGAPDVEKCLEECYIECNQYIEYPIKTQRRFKLPLESFIPKPTLDALKDTSCDDISIKPAVETNLSNIASLVVANDWAEKPLDWVKPGDSSCDYYYSAAQGLWEEGSIIGYPRYNGKKEKVVFLSDPSDLVSEGVVLEMPEEIWITSTDVAWDGIITLSELQNTSVPPEGEVELVFEVGVDNIKLTLDKSARLVLSGQAGNLVSYIDDGALSEISTFCPFDNQEIIDTFLAEEGTCKIDVGDDLVVWTKHFTEFVVYNTIPEDLKLWLPFNGDANDKSGNGNNGVVNGATLTLDRFGNFDGAYNFNGVNDYIDIGDVAELDSLSAITVSVWIKWEGSTGNNQYIVSKRTGGTNSWQIDWNDATQKIVWIVDTGSSVILYSLANAPVGVWTHYVGTYDGSVMRFYVNGIEEDSDVQTGLMDDTTQSVLVGGEPDSPYEDFFNGAIDDVRIYNRALSPSEITELYNYVESSEPESLKLWLPFNGNANDESGNGNNGVVNGATLTLDRFGNFDGAYDFDGESYINVGTSTFGMEESNEFTISLWAQSKGYSDKGTLIHRGAYTYPFSMFFVSEDKYHPNTARLRTWLRVFIEDNLKIKYITYYPSSRTRVNFEEWNHVAMTFTNGVRTIYIDGVEDLSGSIEGTLGLGNNEPTCIGANCIHEGKGFKGAIDDVKIYNRALSSEEISELSQE
jgi:hypothetical protein